MMSQFSTSKTIFLMLGVFVSPLELTKVNLGVLLLSETSESHELSRTRPALEIGFEDALTYYGINFEVIYGNYTSACASSTVAGLVSELYYVDEAKALVGPACSGSIVAAGRLAQYLSLPIVTGQGYLLLRDSNGTDMFKTTTKLSFDIGKLSSKYNLNYDMCTIPQ